MLAATFFGTLCNGILAAESPSPRTGSSDRRPIVLIVFDDMFDFVDQRNLHGVAINTPNLDRLASRGVRFQNAFASIAVCNPSRSSFMTGRSPFRTTVHVPEPVQWNDIMAENASVVHSLRLAGYEAFGTGKVFHNQTRTEQQPFFAKHFDHHFQSRNRLSLPPGRMAQATNRKQADDFHVDWALEKISAYRRESDKPFFLTVGIIRPHRPFIAPQEYFDLYPKAKLNVDRHLTREANDLRDVSDFYKQFRLLNNYHSGLVDKNQTKDFVQGYLASLSYADAQLGRLLDAMDTNPGFKDSTLVVLSDNGYHLGEKSTWNKFTLWEEAAKVPLYVVDQSLQTGTQCNVPVSLLDVAPTLCAVAGTKMELADGDDLVEIAKHPGQYEDRVAITTMIGSLSVRTKQHRMMLYNDGTVELYDIVKDPSERTNLASRPSYKPLISELKSQLKKATDLQGGLAWPNAQKVNGSSQADAVFVIGDQVGAGGLGDDVYFVANGGAVDEGPDGGYDTAYFADVEFEIPKGVEFVRTSMYLNNTIYKIHGNSEDNRVYVTSCRADLQGADGSDVLITGNARDRIDGGPGSDFVRTLNGNNNVLIGGTGCDVIIGGNGSDTIWGDIENPNSSNRDQDNTSDSSSETEKDNEHADLILGGSIRPLSTQETARWSNPKSTNKGGLPLVYFNHQLYLFGKPVDENDAHREWNRLLSQGAETNFTIVQNGSSDTIFAGKGSDLILTLSGDDTVDGGSGPDIVYSHLGKDEIRGGDDEDLLYGGGDDDRVYGDRGDDELYGGLGNDLISGGAGDDRLFGEDGNDRLVGGPGNDKLYGGDGADWFVLPAKACMDFVQDFDPSEDKIVIPKTSRLHTMTDQQIIKSICHTVEADLQIREGEKVMVLVGQGKASLSGCFLRQ